MSALPTPQLSGGLSCRWSYAALKVYNEQGAKIGDVINQGAGWEAHRKGKLLATEATLQDAAELIEAAWKSGN